jgi:hypothetical protein
MEPFTMTKVVDCQKNMPEEIKRALFESYGEDPLSNDSFIYWIAGRDQIIYEDDDYFQQQRKVVDDWFLQNFKEVERVLVLHWW